MNIEEIRQAKSEAEEKIQKAIGEFVTKADCGVSGIDYDVNREYSADDGKIPFPFVHNIKLDVAV